MIGLTVMSFWQLHPNNDRLRYVRLYPTAKGVCNEYSKKMEVYMLEVDACTSANHKTEVERKRIIMIRVLWILTIAHARSFPKRERAEEEWGKVIQSPLLRAEHRKA